MAVESNRSTRISGTWRYLRLPVDALRKVARKIEGGFPFGSLTQRIVILNLFGFAMLVSGILFLNQFRAGLIEAKVQSLLTQGQIIASAIGTSAAIDTGTVSLRVEPAHDQTSAQEKAGIAQPDTGLGAYEFTINPERAAPELRDLIKPTKTRARIYDREGTLVLDSDTLFSVGQILRYDLPPPESQKPDVLTKYWRLMLRWIWARDLPSYVENSGIDGKEITEVASALSGNSIPIVRANDRGELIVSVAVPIQPVHAVLGVLLLSTRGGDIDGIVASERRQIMRIGLFAAVITVLLSMLMAHTIAGPIRELSDAAERVRRRIKARAEIPDYSSRSDEIGHLSRSLRDMTSALYRRLDAIESFAADVSHELKNPLTSLRSAAETLPRIKAKESRQRLMEVIGDDVKRLDRLITDISDASRLDAELSREDSEPIDVAEMIETVVPAFSQSIRKGGSRIVVDLPRDNESARRQLAIVGHKRRLGQVLTNILDNAVSFSPKNGKVVVAARRVGNEVEISVEDDGPGIRPDNLTKIFDRFYTDRPGEESFGKNSGLGLNISQQIVVSHGGSIWAENRTRRTGTGSRSRQTRRKGARLVIRLPAVSAGKARRLVK